MEIDAGYGDNIINPKLPCYLTGYGIYLERKAYSIMDDLKVRAVFLKDKDGNKILIISFDLIGFSVDFSDILRKSISSKFKIPFQNIFISCTHTHSGPPTLELRGMGKPDISYMKSLKEKTEIAVEKAISESGKADGKWIIEEIEPIGFNRAKKSLEPVDTHLGIIIFQKNTEKIYIINYSCHPVTLGINHEISADFPGKLIREIENKGDRGIFLQGFCGDIDPFINKVKWGSGTEDDVNFYGRHIFMRLLKLEKEGIPFKNSSISSIEKRIRIPLQIKSEKELEDEKNYFLNLYKDKGEKYTRFFEEWFEESLRKISGLKENPYLEKVPINVINIGEMKLVGYPGEVFCEMGLSLREKFSPLFPCGYANGNIGYIPTKKAYMNKKDYACYFAPLFYNCFPFSPEIEDIFLKETESILKKGEEDGKTCN